MVLVEFDLCIAGCNGAKLDPVGGENDWLRLCEAGSPVPEGEVMIADLGLVFGAIGSGESEGEPLSKGLLRHRTLPRPVVDIAIFFWIWIWTKQHKIRLIIP